MTIWTTITTPLGVMVLAAEGGALVGAWFEGQQHFTGAAAGWRERPDDSLLCDAAGQLEEYFTHGRRSFELPLAPRGTPFQREVWRRILGIPFGETSSYGEVAAILGRSGGARAVGAATGRNPLSILIPCHRMLGSSGALTGYAGGLGRKRALLALEGVTLGAR